MKKQTKGWRGVKPQRSLDDNVLKDASGGNVDRAALVCNNDDGAYNATSAPDSMSGGCVDYLDHLTITGAVNLGRGVTLKGTR